MESIATILISKTGTKIILRKCRGLPAHAAVVLASLMMNETPEHTPKKKSVYCQALGSLVDHYLPKIKRTQDDYTGTLSFII